MTPSGSGFAATSATATKLTPSILRQRDGSYVDEVALVRHFKAMNPTAAAADASDFDWLVTMQHYLAPTRLLDWTENLLVALYFAVRNEQIDGDADAALWLLNARHLNYHSSATTRSSELAFPSDPDVAARSLLSRSRERYEWHDLFAREIQLLRVDRADYRITRIRQAIAATPAQAKSRKPVKLDGSEVSPTFHSARDLRAYPVARGASRSAINVYDKTSLSQPEGIFTRLRLPVAAYPGRTNRRIRSQAGVFTLHGGKHVPNPTTYVAGQLYDTPIGLPIPLEELETGTRQKRIVKWFRIPKDRRAEIRKTLGLVGVTEAILFPELDYQSKYLADRWTYRAEPEDDEEA